MIEIDRIDRDNPAVRGPKANLPKDAIRRPPDKRTSPLDAPRQPEQPDARGCVEVARC
jgi:hypothetical protein